MSITPGEIVGPYRITEQLGSGGMATVYKAYHASLDRYVAVKILHPAFKANPQFFERFQREARIVANLEHPHIIPVYDFSEHNGEPYLVMRFVEGDTLKHRMDALPMAPTEILHLVRPVCQALSYAHQKGVLHRDIKPSNIMISESGDVFLTDFGLARMVQTGESTLSQDMMVGTPQYISPEQAQGISQLDGRTDIYSLGVVLFEMLTGRVPFSADTPFATVHDHIYTPLPLPSAINPGIDSNVERMLLKTLAKEPKDRFESAAELLTALETTLNIQPTTLSAQKLAQVTATPSAATIINKVSSRQGIVDNKANAESGAVKQPHKQNRWWLWAGGAALILLMCAGAAGGYFLWRQANRTPAPMGLPLPADNLADGLPQPLPPLPGENPPPEADRLADEAAMAMQKHQFDEAADLYRQATTADPHHLPAWFGLSEAIRLGGDPAGSILPLEQAIENNPADPLPLQRLGETYLLMGQPADALPLFAQSIELAPGNATLHAEHALALLGLDEPDTAKQSIDTALALDQLCPEARLANAIYLIKQRDIRSAVTILRQLTRDGRASVFVKNRARRLLDELPQP